MTIKEAREKSGLPQNQAAKLIGVPLKTLQDWEAGIKKCPEYVERLLIQNLLKIAENNLAN